MASEPAAYGLIKDIARLTEYLNAGFDSNGGQDTTNLNPNDYASLLTFSAIDFWVGGFILLYGTRGFPKASFPILFLIFMISFSSPVMDKIIYALQIGSTEANRIFFPFAGVLFQQEGNHTSQILQAS